MSPFSFRSLVALTMAAVTLHGAPRALMAQSTIGVSLTDSASQIVQSPERQAVTPAEARPSIGPRANPVALTARTSVRDTDLDRLSDDNVNAGPNLALMGAGAAGIVIGLLIGGDGGTALAVGGGVVGLVGLYRYLR